MDKVKKSLTILILIGVPLLSAQDIEQSEAVPQRKGEADTVFTAAISRVLKESLVIVPGEREKLGE